MRKWNCCFNQIKPNTALQQLAATLVPEEQSNRENSTVFKGGVVTEQVSSSCSRGAEAK